MAEGEYRLDIASDLQLQGGGMDPRICGFRNYQIGLRVSYLHLYHSACSRGLSYLTQVFHANL